MNSCDKDSEISEKLHNLADDLPHHGSNAYIKKIVTKSKMNVV